MARSEAKMISDLSRWVLSTQRPENKHIWNGLSFEKNFDVFEQKYNCSEADIG